MFRTLAHRWPLFAAAIDRVETLVTRRDPRWPAVRRAHLRVQPACAACGNDDPDAVEVHHIAPVSLCPSRELDPTNLLTLCTCGPGGLNCHLVVGHCGRWTVANPTPKYDANWMLGLLAAGRRSA